MKKFKLRTGDYVRVIAGAHKGAEGKILKVLRKQDRAIVEHVNVVSKHKKPSASNTQGGIEKSEAPIHISNLMLVENGQTVRVGYRMENGKKIRYSKKTNKEI